MLKRPLRVGDYVWIGGDGKIGKPQHLAVVVRHGRDTRYQAEERTFLRDVLTEDNDNGESWWEIDRNYKHLSKALRLATKAEAMALLLTGSYEGLDRFAKEAG